MNCLQMKLKAMLMNVKKESGILPNEYQQLTYIESDINGNQYIDTEYLLTQNSKVDLSFYATRPAQMLVFGSRTSASLNNFEILYSYTNQQVICDFDNYNNNRLTAQIITDTKYNCTISNTEMSINETSKTITSYNDFKTPNTAYLFNVSGNYPSGYRNFVGKIYKCDIYNNNALVRNFIPCYRKSDEAVGMYDIITRKFYTNQGIGNFSKGDVV